MSEMAPGTADGQREADLPEPAIGREPPPPLPAVVAAPADRPIHEIAGPVYDTALTAGLTGLRSWTSRISVDPSPWSVTTYLHAGAPARTVAPPGAPGQRPVEEPQLRLKVVAV